MYFFTHIRTQFSYIRKMLILTAYLLTHLLFISVFIYVIIITLYCCGILAILAVHETGRLRVLYYYYYYIYSLSIYHRK